MTEAYTLTAADTATLAAAGTIQLTLAGAVLTPPPPPPPPPAVTNPGAPGTPIVSAVSTTGAVLTWTAAAAGSNPLAGYQVQVDAGPWSAVAPALVATLTGLTPGTAYTVNVQAVDTAGDIGPVATGAFSTNAVGALPGLPGSLQVTAQTAGGAALGWTAALAGANPIASYNIYRNGKKYANTTGLTYSDISAPLTCDPTYKTAATIYQYAVSAVDSAGQEGPQQTLCQVWLYRGGSKCGNGDLSYQMAAPNYTDTAGALTPGPEDVAVTWAAGGGWQPTSGAPLCPQWDLEIGAMSGGYLYLDLKLPNNANQQFVLSAMSRLPNGDVYPYAAVINPLKYCVPSAANPAGVFTPNVQCTYKVPLSALGLGVSQFTGSIAGTTLTCASIQSGPGPDAGGFVTGPGVPAGTYVLSYGQKAGIGSFTLGNSVSSLAGLTVPAGTKLTFQRSNLYKIDLYLTGGTGPAGYAGNLGFGNA